ncbi:MAG: FAD-binding oxidoreductase [Calditrichaeota bacterium]|nr:MAG: FAD-binding oxidoreductase [Calditrichota bacterium]MBL1205387.1 FAD-binding oxidoreductase [Calditrichota bacterium]NOG45216.1 FAD-dependent oxidoreductase [Calditrichota bacterium]
MYDFLIIGQGIAGSLLAYNLIQKGKTVLIIDDANPNSSSRVAGGLINPITGKRLQKTWLADQLFPYAHKFYTSLEKSLDVSFFHPKPVVRIFADARQANDWTAKCSASELHAYLNPDYNFVNQKSFNIPDGYTVFDQGAVLDCAAMLEALAEYFLQKNCLIKQEVNYKEFSHNGIISLDNIKAENIVFCEGWKGALNPWFNWLPFVPSKGDVLTVKIDNLKMDEIVSRGIFIRPLKDNIYRVGSTYIWDDQSELPTQKGIDELCGKLKSLLKTPFEVIDHKAGIRPTVRDRRPFLGQHPQYKNMYIFNGLGTKGVLLAPRFATHFVEVLANERKLNSEVDIKRFVETQNN